LLPQLIQVLEKKSKKTGQRATESVPWPEGNPAKEVYLKQGFKVWGVANSKSPSSATHI